MVSRQFWVNTVLAAVGLVASSCGESTPAGDGSAGQSGVTGACPDGQTLCSGACVSLTENTANCGACGQACSTGQACVAGSCTCMAGLTDCDGSCVNLAADGANCGACGNVCPANMVCSLGECSNGCAAGLTQCGSGCVDITADVNHCGGCDQPCLPGQDCVEGSCTCPAGQTLCADVCTNTSTDPSNCGSCGNTCAGGSCIAGQCSSAGSGGAGTGGNGVVGSGGASGGVVGAGGDPGSGGVVETGGVVGTGGTGVGGSDTGGAPGTGGTGVGGSDTGGTGTGGTGVGGSDTGGAPGTGGTGVGGATGGAAGQGSGTGGGGAVDPSLPPRICDEPAPWDVPASTQVVGDGSAASCTASALRDAVAGGGHVTFNCGADPVSITVSSAMEAADGTVVDGEGKVTLDGGGTSQIFIAPDNSSLSVRNLRFINGRAPASEESDGIGGAVAGKWRSAVEVRGCTFEDNTAGRGGGAVAVWTGSSLTIVASRFMRNSSFYGGAVYSLLSPLTVVNSEFVDNDTIDNGWAEGGAIGTDGASESPDDSLGGTIEICGTQILNNQGLSSGGGVYIWVYPPDLVTIDRTTLEGNVVGGSGLGGAMRISNGEIIIKASSFLSNTSDNHAGALYLDCTPTCTITNCTFYGNQAGSWGGAISTGTPVSMNNVTFADNAQGTGDNALFGSGPWTLNNTIFLNNGCGEMGTGDHVLQQGGSGSCVSGAISGDPMLAAPADNGGPTFTMLPGAGSAALGAGAGCEATDQRGEPRNTAACDLGAVEVP